MLANKTISVEYPTNWPEVKFAPFQKVLTWEGESLNSDEGNWEVYGIELELYIIPFSVRWRCTYYLVRSVATADNFEQIRTTESRDPTCVAHPDYPASSEISALDQWDIKFNIGQIVRRLEDNELYKIEGIVFKFMGPQKCRNYWICRLDGCDSQSDWKDSYVEDEMLLRESDLHL